MIGRDHASIRHPGLLTFCILLAISTYLTRPLAAQVNTEKMRLAKPAHGLSGELGCTAAFHSGNVEFVDIGVQGRVDLDDSLWLAFVTGTFQLRSQSHNVFDRNAFIHARFNLPLSQRVIAEVFVQQEYNKSLRLKNRSLAGAGIRVPIISTEDVQTIAGSSWMFEYEERSQTTSTTGEPIARVFRWNTYLVLRYAGIPHVLLANTIYVQPRPDAWNDTRVFSEGTLTVGLSKVISLTNALTYRYDSEPPDGIRPFDLAFRTGIVFSF